MNADVSKPRVLIVDDDRTILHVLGSVLARDYDTVLANNASEGLIAVRARKPDVIICDIRMPDHDGFWLMAEVKKIDADIPFILHSAYQDSYQADDVQTLFKPFAMLAKGASLVEVRRVVSAALQARRLKRA